LSAWATDSWYEYLNGTGDERWHDWIEINKDLNEYVWLGTLDVFNSNAEMDSFYKVKNRFKEKKEKLIKADGFNDMDATYYDYPSPPWPNEPVHYRNKYLLIFFIDLNGEKERKEENYYTDYHEESGF
tara:strand:- start:457 stop:840 length:384 start_codon:yes stop_codon:yes gene_type:complete